MSHIPNVPVDQMPVSGCHILFLDVDHNGVTSEGERFDIKPKVYRGHATVEHVVIRFPDGCLQLVERVTPARHAV